MRRALLACAALLLSCGSDRERVVVIAHRGAGNIEVENSLAAFRTAKKQGADGVELDVALTRDGINVVMHDDLLDRTTTCTGAVRDRTLAELSSCTLKNGEPIRTLEQMLREMAGEFERVFVEIKVFDDRAVAQADDTIEQILRSGHVANVVTSSYDDTANARLAERQKDGIVAGWDARTDQALTQAQKHGSQWALLPFEVLGPHTGDLAKAAGKQLCVYVISSRADFTTAYDAGVRVMMTDSVPLLRAAIDE